MEGATFSVTALGSYGVDFFTPVINPPNVAILGVGRIRDTAVWDGEDDDPTAASARPDVESHLSTIARSTGPRGASSSTPSRASSNSRSGWSRRGQGTNQSVSIEFERGVFAVTATEGCSPDRPGSPTRSCSTTTRGRCPRCCVCSRLPDRRNLDDIPIERYISREWHEREEGATLEAGCGSSHVGRAHPEPGDYYVTRSRNMSFIVVRTATREIKAYPNGVSASWTPTQGVRRPLQRDPLPVPRLRVGARRQLADVPAAWDFPQIEERHDDFDLPELKVATWAGFLSSSIRSGRGAALRLSRRLPEHFASWDLEDRYVEAHVVKIINANWKIAQERSARRTTSTVRTLRSSRISATPTARSTCGTPSAGWSRPGASSPLLDWEPTKDEMLRAMLDVRLDQQLPDGLPERRTVGPDHRGRGRPRSLAVCRRRRGGQLE